jgi:hypothetical protein
VQSFIVKLWLEGPAVGGPRRLSHGYVTQVSSGERRYVNSLGQIRNFIAERLEAAGVKVGVRWWVAWRSKRRRPRRD